MRFVVINVSINIKFQLIDPLKMYSFVSSKKFNKTPGTILNKKLILFFHGLLPSYLLCIMNSCVVILMFFKIGDKFNCVSKCNLIKRKNVKFL